MEKIIELFTNVIVITIAVILGIFIGIIFAAILARIIIFINKIFKKN